MNTSEFKGGRGKRAPYETAMYRIPLPIKPAVELFARAYRLAIDEGVTDPTGEKLISTVEDALNPDFDTTVEFQQLRAENEQLRSRLDKVEQIANAFKPAITPEKDKGTYRRNIASPLKKLAEKLLETLSE